ncbi:MAG: hypothetical protein PVF69_12475, partial [Gemmatimonadota bacterium]
YQNEDGTWTLSFGFMNRNEEDLIEIPLGENNFIEPAQYDGDQPTSFPVVSYPGFGGPRERGAFGVIVPADFEGEVWWTLTTDGYTTKVPGRLHAPERAITFESAYGLSTTPQAEGSLRPTLTFTEGGDPYWGLHGIEHPRHFTTEVGEPIEVTVWAWDRGERELADVNVTLWKFQGPVGAKVSFASLLPEPPEEEDGGRRRGGFSFGGGAPTLYGPGPAEIGQPIRVPTEGPSADKLTFSAAFDTPGEYRIRVRVDNWTAGDSQAGNACCWSNGYVNVTVTE